MVGLIACFAAGETQLSHVLFVTRSDIILKMIGILTLVIILSTWTTAVPSFHTSNNKTDIQEKIFMRLRQTLPLNAVVKCFYPFYSRMCSMIFKKISLIRLRKRPKINVLQYLDPLKGNSVYFLLFLQEKCTAIVLCGHLILRRRRIYSGVLLGILIIFCTYLLDHVLLHNIRQAHFISSQFRVDSKGEHVQGNYGFCDKTCSGKFH